MKITKTVSITIEVDDAETCSPHCKFNCEGDVCAQYDTIINVLRCPQCIAEFGKGEE